jgi:hypothetical protein
VIVIFGSADPSAVITSNPRTRSVTMQKKEELELVIEQLEERIAPGVVTGHPNNGFGNGPNDGIPGHSDHTDSDR